MRALSLRLKNWGPFRGAHELALEPKIYSISARYEEDADRSNWSGKSILAEAIRFALTGWHRFELEDQWISEGEQAGEVELRVGSEGESMRVLRSRTRGKTTRLLVEQAGGEAAQGAIWEALGVGSDADLLATSFFAQREIARISLARPAEMADVVSNWLRLGPIEACEDSAQEALAAARCRVGEAEGNLKAARLALAELLGERSEEALAKSVELLGVEMAGALGRVAVAGEAVERNAEAMHLQASAADYRDLVEEGTRLREEVEGVPIEPLALIAREARAAHQGLLEKLGHAKRHARSRTQLLTDGFDGTCPVAGIKCPVRTQVDNVVQTDRAAQQKAADEVLALEMRVARVDAERREAEAAHQGHERKQDRLRDLRDRALKIQEAADRAEVVGEPQDPQVLRARLAQEQALADQARASLAREEGRMEALAAAKARIAGCERAAAEARALAEAPTAAAAVFRAAKRRVADSGVRAIEEGANALLQRCGIDLGVRFEWSRETGAPARACEACGAAFAASAKQKVCQRCGAARGHQVAHKPRLVLSDRSAAAEDLAGAAMQLSAAAWLRRDRGSQWAAAFLDEAFAHCDRSNRRALAQHLAAMLSSEYGYEQAFVISHTPDTSEVFPGRIEILVGRDGSRRVTVA